MNAKHNISASGFRLAEDDDSAPRGGLMILNEEDGAADTIIPRPLIVINPISSYLGKADSHKDAEVQGAHPTQLGTKPAPQQRAGGQLKRCIAA